MATNTPATIRDTVAAKASVDGTVAQLIERQKGAIARALPRTLDPDRFARIVLTEVKANPQLLTCEPVSLLAAVMRAAQLGLEPGTLGHVYLVPFRNGKTGRTEVQFILGYKGMIELARRSGEISELYGDVVYDGDEFSYQLGLHRDLVHRRNPGSDRGHITHAYAVARFKDGGIAFEVLDEIEIAARRNRSRAKDSGPWVSDFAMMAIKSAVRKLHRWLPLTVEASAAMDSDDRSYSLDDFGDVIDITDAEEVPAAIETTTTEVGE